MVLSQPRGVNSSKCGGQIVRRRTFGIDKTGGFLSCLGEPEK